MVIKSFQKYKKNEKVFRTIFKSNNLKKKKCFNVTLTRIFFTLVHSIF